MPRLLEQPVASGERIFDGIICFGGEDWWYHNRGHYDIRMMRELSKRVPVLYVNSLGMRAPNPREGAMFVRRVLRKLASLRRGFVRVDDHFGVLSPISFPGEWSAAVTKRWLTKRVVEAAQAMDIMRPLIWVACPTAAGVIDAIDRAGLVYQRTDRYECYPGVQPSRIKAFDDRLKADADLTVFCGDFLFERESAQCRQACRIDHGIDFERFENAGRRRGEEPIDIVDLGRPRVGFVGGIDAHTFDVRLFVETAQQLPEIQFVLVGACSLPAGWCELPNVALLGQKPHEEVPAYMAACDVLIMPWRRNQWIQACNPVKLKEYLAVGRPIVSTDFTQLRRYDSQVRVASTPQTFCAEIRSALSDPGDEKARRAQVADQAWSGAAERLLDELHVIGLISAHGSRIPKDDQADTTPPATVGRLRLVGGDWFNATNSRPGLRACLVLAGGLRPSPLVEAAGRSVLDLYLTPEKTVLDVMVEQLTLLPSSDGMPLAIRVVYNGRLPAPWPGTSAPNVRFEQDPQAYRGAAGLVADLCAGYEDHEHVLVVEAGRVLARDVESMWDEHLASDADVTVGCNQDGSPGGVYITRCGVLRHIPPIGFVDIKEQWLASAGDRGVKVRVHGFSSPGALPLRTRSDFLAAARHVNNHVASRACRSIASPPAQAAGLEPFRVIGHGAAIGPDVHINDAVIMPAAVIGGGALIEHSVVCPGAVIEPKLRVVNAVVSRSGFYVDQFVTTASIPGLFSESNLHAKAA
ncbi:MAG: glycosyltransferase [Planctomycetes bacterium]|nr:glycosyltransferase [Planctomycetota bacterium]